MPQQEIGMESEAGMELATFYIGDSLCGMDILSVQEINKQLRITRVPQAPEYVLGVLNLRGRIVTVIDLGRKLGLSPTVLSPESRNIIVNSSDEYIGLLVDGIGDVVVAGKEDVEPPPANIGGLKGKYFQGVLKTGQNLVGILDIQQVMKDEALQAA